MRKEGEPPLSRVPGLRRPKEEVKGGMGEEKRRREEIPVMGDTCYIINKPRFRR
jgi:hypothetical protein